MLSRIRICGIGLVVALACIAVNLSRYAVEHGAAAAEPALIAQASSTAKPVLLVGHKWSDSAGFYDAATGKLETSIQVGRRPHELAVSRDGRRAYFTLYGIDLYTETSEGGRSVAVVDIPSRTKLGEIDLGEYRRPHGIEIGPKSGRLYVTCDRNFRIAPGDNLRGSMRRNYAARVLSCQRRLENHPSSRALIATRSSRFGRKIVSNISGKYQAM